MSPHPKFKRLDVQIKNQIHEIESWFEIHHYQKDSAHHPVIARDIKADTAGLNRKLKRLISLAAALGEDKLKIKKKI